MDRSPGSEVMIWSPWSASATKGGINCVGMATAGDQDSSVSSKHGIKRHDLNGLQRNREARLASGSAAPNLGNYAPVRFRWALGLKGSLEPSPHSAVVAFQCD